MSNHHQISSTHLSVEQINEILSQKRSLALAPEARQKIEHCRSYLDKKLAETDDLIYGVNTGFGSLCNVQISKAQLKELQKNLVMSHACGTGEEVPREIIKLMLLLKVQSLSYGHSGASIETVERLIDLYNEDILPVVYEQGSLGASGDLAPLAHLSLPLLGMGEVWHKGQKKQSAEVLKEKGWQPVELQSKEGLALLNGTQFMSAYGLWGLHKMSRLMDWADIIAALSIDAFDCKLSPFNDLIHQVRPHRGQIETAQAILKILEDSEIAGREKKQVQDSYSFRCIPQVHGASRGAVGHVREVFETEINAVTDNPNIFPEEDRIISGGNFHGQPLALALDYFAMAAAELGNIAERRIYKLISGERGLPPFLVADPGLNSGFMIPQYTAASIVSQNKQLCTPASVDSITSSNGQEDHVSMGANAATKAYKVVSNLETILAIELLTAAQALEFRRPAKTSPKLEEILSAFRKEVSFNKHDRLMHDDIMKSVKFVRGYEL